MKRMLFFVILLSAILLSVLVLFGDSPEDWIEIRTNLAEGKMDFHINNSKDEALHYTVLYNNKVYKTYTRTDKDWSILYDYSFKDVTKVTIRATNEAGHMYEKSVLVVIEPDGFDYSKNELEIYFASHYEITLKEIAALGENLVSIDLEGQGVSGDMMDLKDCQQLKRLSMKDCTKVTGDMEILKGILDLSEK